MDSLDKISNYNQILDSIATGIFTVDMDLNITFFNREAEKITGFNKSEALGRKCYEVFRTELCFKGCYLKIALSRRGKIIKGRNKILNKDNREIPVDITVTVLKNGKGKVIGGIESFIDDSARVTLEKKLEKSYIFDDIIGQDEKIVDLFDVVSVIAPTDFNVLILGETGSGKDLFARALHNSSHRKKGPFVKVNCPALPINLMESELFGYARGAFTDAKQTKKGRFQTAEGGTIFLDEIGDLSLEIQAKLFQVLDEKEFYPLGATVPVKVNVRIIASTNKDLAKMMEAGTFRNDLYYRIKVVELKIPPLRERPLDIPLLVDHFLTRQAYLMGKKSLTVTPEVMKILVNYDYPGNVRELKHIIEHATIVCQKDLIEIDELPEYLAKRKTQTNSPSTLMATLSAHQSILNKEKEIIIDVLRAQGGHRCKSAQSLSINRTTLWRKMKKYGLLPRK